MAKEFDLEVGSLVKNKIEKLGNRKPVVFYGSSSFRLWESLEQDFPELDCLNIAFGGSTIRDCSDYYEVLLKQVDPSQIIFYGGDNDIGQEVSVEHTFDRFKELFTKIREDFKNIPFAFVSIKPSPERILLLNKIQSVNSLIKDFLEKEKESFFIDVHSDMLEKGMIKERLFCDDKLHMNSDGYLVWKQNLRSYLFL